MRRRQFMIDAASVMLLSGYGVVLDLGKRTTPRMRHVGILDGSAADDPISSNEIASLKHGLSELGSADGQTIVFEERHADNNFAQLPALANELVQNQVDVLVTVSGSPAALVAQQATTTVPHCLHECYRSGRHGLCGQSRPSRRNVTGVLGVQLQSLDVRSPDDMEPSMAAARAWPAQAMTVLGGPGSVADATPRLVDFQVHKHIRMTVNAKRLSRPVACSPTGTAPPWEAWQPQPMLTNFSGAKRAELPVEQPSVYELVVNQTTAQSVGITIPPTIAQQVTQWVQ